MCGEPSVPGLTWQQHTVLDSFIRKLWGTGSCLLLDCDTNKYPQLLAVQLGSDPINPTSWLIVGCSLKLEGCSGLATTI